MWTFITSTHRDTGTELVLHDRPAWSVLMELAAIWLIERRWLHFRGSPAYRLANLLMFCAELGERELFRMPVPDGLAEAIEAHDAREANS